MTRLEDPTPDDRLGFGPYVSGIGNIIRKAHPNDLPFAVGIYSSLPGCVSQGRTRDDALRNIGEAVEAYIESLRKHDEPIPPGIQEELVDVAGG